MEKPILATSVDNILIDSLAFTEPHKEWFDRVIKKTGDISLKKWKGKENYFIGVNKAMEKIMPNASKEKRTKQARTWYQKDVMEYIKTHPETIRKQIVKKLEKKKEKYILALITTNTSKYINKILKVSNLQNIYEIIYASSSKKEPKKLELINAFIKKYGKPEYYLTKIQEPRLVKKIKNLGIKIIGVNELDKI